VAVEKPADGLVRLGRQFIRVGQPILHSNGHGSRLAVRPEELKPGIFAGENNLNGSVVSVTYLGSIVRIGIDVEGNPLSLDVFNERKLTIPSVGQTYQVSFPVDACWIL